MQDFKTDISMQAESYADGLILYLLQDVHGGVRQMHICDTAIFKNRPDIYFIQSQQGLWFGPTPCQYSKGLHEIIARV